MSQPSPLRPAGDVIGDLVALVERETAALSNAEAWSKILELAEARCVTGKTKGQFRDLVWKARTAAIEAKRAERAAKKAPAREKSWAKLCRRVELSRERKDRPDKLRAIRSLRSDIVVER
jgi:hypothetical protein